MPYKNDERQKIAIRRNARKHRSIVSGVRGVSSFAGILSDFLESESTVREQGEPVTLKAVLSLLRPLTRRLDELEAIEKRFEETMLAFEALKAGATTEKVVDHVEIENTEYELHCPKHGRERRKDRMEGSCC